MDFLKLSNKTTTPYSRSESMSCINQTQHKDSSFDFKDLEIHPHTNIIPPCNNLSSYGYYYYYYYPFTNAQLKELERQAMIYKYMIASLPVPFDLLLSTSSAFPRNNKNIAGDLEPGRCKRTDGKKWRCSKEVVSNHKYCEKHLHRGRPRSRKHVEPLYSRPNSNNNNTDNVGYEKNRDFLNTRKHKRTEPRKVSSPLLNYRESRGNELCPITSTTNQDNKYLNFIDVWSDGVSSSEKQTTTSTPHVSSSNSHHSLDLSMGGNNLTGHVKTGIGATGSRHDEDTHGYGPYDVTSLEEMSSWLAPMSATPGGPLAEILRPNPNVACTRGIESYSLTARSLPSGQEDN